MSALDHSLAQLDGVIARLAAIRERWVLTRERSIGEEDAVDECEIALDGAVPS